MVPYLLVADLQNTALSAILVFSDRILYPSYSVAPRLFGFSAQEDQVAAGSIMWVVGSLAYIVPAILIAMQCLSRKRLHAEVAVVGKRDASVLDDILAAPQRIPYVSQFVRSRFSGKTIEAASFVLLFVAACLCFAGLLASGSGDDDDQVVRLRATSGPFAVSVYAPPGDFAAGPTTISVLVQDRNTGETLLDPTVDLTIHSAADSGGAPATARATPERSQNKLLQTAELNLLAEGEWTISIAVQRNSDHADFAFPLYVVKAETGVEFPWSYVVILSFAAILLVAYVRRHRAAKPFPLEHPVASP